MLASERLRVPFAMETPFCIALVPSSASKRVWKHCKSRAMRDDRFCCEHRLALVGAVMGFIDTQEYRNAQTLYRKKSALRVRHRSVCQSRASARKHGIDVLSGGESPREGRRQGKGKGKLQTKQISKLALAEFFNQ